MTVSPSAVAREALAVIALSHVGRGDIHEEVWLDVLRPPQANPVDGRGRPLSWCRAFALYCLRDRYRAAHDAEPPEDWIWIPGRGFELPLGLPQRRLPRVGDIAYRDSNQHGAVVVRVHDSATIDTVDGNSSDGRNSGVVVLRERTPTSSWLTFFDTEAMLV